MRKVERAEVPATGAMVFGILLAALILGGCDRVTDEEIVVASGIVLQDQLDGDYADVFDTWWRAVPWTSESTAQTRVDNDAMPLWARETYDMCVYWERPFSRTSTVRQQGPDIVERHSGIAWGWILMNRRLEFHILETGFQWTDSEDDVPVQSGSRVVIDAWEAPLPEEPAQ